MLKHLSITGVPLIEVARENGLTASCVYKRIKQGVPQQDACYKMFATAKKRRIYRFINAAKSYNAAKTLTVKTSFIKSLSA